MTKFRFIPIARPIHALAVKHHSFHLDDQESIRIGLRTFLRYLSFVQENQVMGLRHGHQQTEQVNGVVMRHLSPKCNISSVFGVAMEGAVQLL